MIVVEHCHWTHNTHNNRTINPQLIWHCVTKSFPMEFDFKCLANRSIKIEVFVLVLARIPLTYTHLPTYQRTGNNRCKTQVIQELVDIQHYSRSDSLPLVLRTYIWFQPFTAYRWWNGHHWHYHLPELFFSYRSITSLVPPSTVRK